MRDYGKVDFSYWVDAQGVKRRTPMGKKLNFPRVPLHADLRFFIYRRDKFICQDCGTMPNFINIDYSGKDNLEVMRKSRSGYSLWLVIDHILSRRNGGGNHPCNLQTLCYACNSAKAGLIDSLGAR